MPVVPMPREPISATFRQAVADGDLAAAAVLAWLADDREAAETIAASGRAALDALEWRLKKLGWANVRGERIEVDAEHPYFVTLQGTCDAPPQSDHGLRCFVRAGTFRVERLPRAGVRSL